MKIHGTAKGGALSKKDFGVAFGGGGSGGCENFEDSLGTDANGSNTGSTIDTSNPKVGVGCVSFDGTNDFVNINGAVDFSTTVGSISLWVYLPEEQDNTIFTFTQASSNEYLLIKANGDFAQASMRLASGTPNQQWEVNSPTLAMGAWHLIQLVQDGSAVKAFFDNTEQETFADSTDKSKWMTANMDTGRIGCTKRNGGSDSDFFTGLCDDIGLWNTAIDEDTRNHIWNSGNGNTISSLSNCAGIRAYYNCDEFDNSTLTNNAVPIE